MVMWDVDLAGRTYFCLNSNHPNEALLAQIRYYRDHLSIRYTAHVYENLYLSIIAINYFALWLACLMLLYV
jgi:hypothetical protein